MARPKKTRSKAAMDRLVYNLEQREGRKGEPEVSGVMLDNLAMIKTFNWYWDYYDSNDGLGFVLDYLKTVKFPRQDLDYIKRTDGADLIRAGISAGWIARILTRGGKLPEETKKRFGKAIYVLVDLGKAKATAVKAAARVPVRDRTKAKIDGITALVEDAIDAFTTAGTAFDAAEFVRQHDIKADQAKAIYARYKPLFDELSEAMKGRDADLKEAYRFLSKPKLKAYVAFIGDILSAFNTAERVAKATRKPRKVRVKPVTKVVAKVKYAKTFGDFTSIDPAKIVGAQQVWVYNTKTRTLGAYRATGAGLTVKGTTLQGWDETASLAKRLRKPEDQLKALQETGKVGLRTFLERVRAKPKALTGRLNADTLIMKVVT